MQQWLKVNLIARNTASPDAKEESDVASDASGQRAARTRPTSSRE
jgi:hypothetical protein